MLRELGNTSRPVTLCITDPFLTPQGMRKLQWVTATKDTPSDNAANEAKVSDVAGCESRLIVGVHVARARGVAVCFAAETVD